MTVGDVGLFELHGYLGDGLLTADDAKNDHLLLQSFADTVVSFPDRDFDVTAFIQAGAASGAPCAGFLVKAVSQNVLDGFASVEHAQAEKRPFLRVTTTSVPVEESTWGRIKTLYP